eukprot:356191-Chlamydomonas_euryale.AAC.15
MTLSDSEASCMHALRTSAKLQKQAHVAPRFFVELSRRACVVHACQAAETSTHLEPTHHKELLAEVQAEGAHSAVMHELKHKFVEDASGGGLHLAHPPQASVHEHSVPAVMGGPPMDASYSYMHACRSIRQVTQFFSQCCPERSVPPPRVVRSGGGYGTVPNER